MTTSGPDGALGVGIAGLVIMVIGVITWRDLRYICLFPFSNGIHHLYLGPATLAFGVVFLAGALADASSGPLRIVLNVVAAFGALVYVALLAVGHRRPMNDEDEDS